MKKSILPLLLLLLLTCCLILLVSIGASSQSARLTATAHSNAITITPGASPAGVVVTSFNIYRSKTSGTELPGTPYASLPFANPTTYTDTAVSSGDLNFYVVTAVCSTCSTKESAASAELVGQTPVDGPPAKPNVSIQTL